MLRWNILRVTRLRGIEKPYAFFRKRGFSHYTAYNMAKGKPGNLSLAKIEQVCLALKCSPTDLLEFIPTQNTSAAHQVFDSLKKDGSQQSLKNMLNKMSFSEINTVVEEINRKKKAQ
jgi:DNA-binding Xre family transcriptional regulator